MVIDSHEHIMFPIKMQLETIFRALKNTCLGAYLSPGHDRRDKMLNVAM